MSAPICIAYPTIMDGLVLRWWLDEASYRNGDGEVASASRNCFMTFDSCPADVARSADQAHSYLTVRYAASLHPRLDVSRWVTHTTRFPGRELTPVAPSGAKSNHAETPER
jgi:hypothetical protein